MIRTLPAATLTSRFGGLNLRMPISRLGGRTKMLRQTTAHRPIQS